MDHTRCSKQSLRRSATGRLWKAKKTIIIGTNVTQCNEYEYSVVFVSAVLGMQKQYHIKHADLNSCKTVQAIHVFILFSRVSITTKLVVTAAVFY